MHHGFAGDNKDHGKGFVISACLEGVEDIDLRVDPMLSDTPWTERDREKVEAYARFLRLGSSSRIVNHTRRYAGLQVWKENGRRVDSFSVHEGQEYDLFLDADNGLGTGGRTHLPFGKLETLLPARSNRVLLVFQTRPQRQNKRRFEEGLLERLKLMGSQGFLCFLGQDTYTAVIARDGCKRLRHFRKALEQALGPFAGSRIIP
jgi:hypothetical protein